MRDLGALTPRKIIDFPQFSDLKYHSIPHLCQIAKKRFYGID
jgi:hypothetical protein